MRLLGEGLVFLDVSELEIFEMEKGSELKEYEMYRGPCFTYVSWDGCRVQAFGKIMIADSYIDCDELAFT